MQKKVKVNIGEFRKLSQKCEKLEKIIKLLQESPFINEVPPSELLPYLEQLNKKNENIHVICEAFCVPRGTFYNYILRRKHGNTKAAQNRAELLPLIEKIYSESDHIYGAGKIAAILNNNGHKVSDRLVARIMHENGMFSIRGGSKKCICKE